MLLEQDRSVEEMNFVIPTGFRNGDEDEFGGYDLDHDMESESHDRLLKIQGLDFIKKTVVVERGGYLAVDDGPAQIMSEGWDLVCLPGSFIWEKGEEDKGGNSDYQKQENKKTRTWRSPARSFDYLEGVKHLLMEEDEVSVHANGGRRERKAVPISRRLTAFGGCPFIEDKGIIMPVRSSVPSER